MSESDNLEKMASDFIGVLSCPMDKNETEIAVLEQIFNSMTEPELECLSEIDEDISKPQKYKLANMFAEVAGWVGLEDSVASYISIDETTTSTVEELEEIGFPSFANLVAIARARHGL